MPALDGMWVLNTRPEQRATALCQVLEQAGARVSSLPLLEIEPLPLSDSVRSLALDLDRYQAVFVVSPTAASLGLQWLDSYWPQWPLGITWLAIGAATATVLRQAGLEPLVPQQETSEGLLTLPVLRDLSPGSRLLVLRGEGGRNLVRDTLQARAVRVDYVDLYRRRLPPTTPSLWQQLSVQGLPDAVIITSGEALQHWWAVAGPAASQICCVVVSPRLQEQALHLGCQTVVLAPGMAADGLVAALATWRDTKKRVID